MSNLNTIPTLPRQKIDRSRFRSDSRAHSSPNHFSLPKREVDYSRQPYSVNTRLAHVSVSSKDSANEAMIAKPPERTALSRKVESGRRLKPIINTHFWLLENLPFPGITETVTWKKLSRVWRRYDHRWGWAWRVANGVMAAMVFVSLLAAIPPLVKLLEGNRYQLTASTLKLVGTPDKSLASKLTYDASTQEYQFNTDALTQSASPQDATAALLKSQAASTDKSNDPLYALDVPQDFSKGVTYHDTNTELAFTLTPSFKSLNGQQQQNHIVYPLDGGAQAVYTLKGNGLQEDLVVPKATTDQQTFSYSLHLPDTLAAKIIPGTGAIGIYSADPSLYGTITYGSDADRAKVMNARVKSPKTNLVFGLPAPVIKDAKGVAAKASAHFDLKGNTLSVVASGLKSIKGAFTIDPSVVVTSTSDFGNTGINDGGISFPSNQINRAGLTGGTVGSWGSPGTNNPSEVRKTGAGVAYNGYMYMVGGNTGSAAINTVYIASIGGSGTLGSWSLSGSTLTTNRENLGVVAYNGYLYAYGGDDGTSSLSSVEYASITPGTGALGSWTSGSHAMVTGVCRFGYAAYNGYLYATEGGTSSTGCINSSAVTNNVQFAPFMANGNVGTWANTTASLSTLDGSGRHSNSSVAYNGYLYIMGGTVNGTGGPTSVFYGKMGANGDVTSWATTTSLPIVHYRQGVTVMNGYIYLAGGSAGSFSTDTLYVPINADGSLGAWNATSSFTTARWGEAMTSYNGYIYINGGTTGSILFDTQYALADPAGALGDYNAGGQTWAGNERRGTQEVAYNNNLYVIGGDAGTAVATVASAPLNGDGTIGAYTTTNMTALPGNRTFSSAVVANGNVYVIGGCSSLFTSCSTAANDNTTVYMNTFSSTGTLPNAWATETAITTARYGQAAVAYGNYMYVMGGLNGATYKNDVQYQAFGSGGTLTGTWTTAAAGLNVPTARAMFGATVYGGYLYIAGGIHTASDTACNGTASLYCSDVQYIQLDGTTNPFISSGWTSTNSFTTARDGLGLVAANGMLYMLGGFNGTTYFSDTQYATINSNGSISTWTTSGGGTLGNNAYAMGATAYNGFIYESGGYDGTTFYNTTQIAPLNNGGTGWVGGWTTNGVTLSTRSNFGTAVYNGYIYVAGDCTTAQPCSSFGNAFGYASINSNGSIGSWTNTTVPTGVYGAGLVAANGYLYLAGGFTGSYTTAVYSTPLSTSDGSIGSWTAQTSLGTGVADGVLLTSNGYIYDVGGVNGGGNTNLVQYATITSPGVTGSWSTTTALPVTTTGESAVINNGYMYVMGLSTTNTAVYYAAISAVNGTVGSWTATTSAQVGSNNATAVVYDGYIYEVGGYNGTTYSNGVQYAPINSNGTLGAWGNGKAFSTGRELAGVAVYNGDLYVIDGDAGSTPFTDIQYAPLDSIPRIGHFSMIFGLGTDATLLSIAYNGSLPAIDGTSKVNYSPAPSSGIFGAQASAASLPGGTGGFGACAGGGGGGTYYVLVSLTLDDSYNTAFLDTAGPDANVTDFTVYYANNIGHPAPSIRLRGGAFFSTIGLGLEPLDTCGVLG